MDGDGADGRLHRLPGLDDNEQRCWLTFLDASTLLLDKVNRRLVERHQLTMFEFLVLEALAVSVGGSARMGDLAQSTVQSPSRLTELVHRLEDQGLVLRRRSKADGRGVVAWITPAGRARLRPAFRTYVQAVRDHYFAGLTRQQMIALGDSCRRIGVPLKAVAKARRRTEG